MNTPSKLALGALFAAVLSFTTGLQAGDYQPELFEKTKLVYEDSFDGDSINLDFWELRQHSTWEIKDGVLTGSQSSKEFQEKMVAKGDPAHAGFKPVIWLRQVPENFVATFRLKYSAEDYDKKFPLIDLGHHIHTFSFAKDSTTLAIRKNVQIETIDEPFLPLNEWVDVAIELKNGKLLFKIDDHKYELESEEIYMGDQRQIDFKGVNFGTCEIDDVKIWEGL